MRKKTKKTNNGRSLDGKPVRLPALRAPKTPADWQKHHLQVAEHCFSAASRKRKAARDRFSAFRLPDTTAPDQKFTRIPFIEDYQSISIAPSRHLTRESITIYYRGWKRLKNAKQQAICYRRKWRRLICYRGIF